MGTKFIKEHKNLIINFVCIIIILILFLIRSILANVLNKIMIISAISIGLALIITSLIILIVQKDKDSKLKKYFSLVNEYYQVVLLVLVVIEVVFGFIFFPATVKQTSMTPTLQPEDTLIVTSTTKITNNDIIVFEYDNTIQKDNVNIENKELLIKRVIGKPGQTLEYKSDGLYINDAKTDDNFFIPSMIGITVYSLAKQNGIEDLCKQSDGTYVIPEGWYVVFGDHREVSVDSRMFGLVHEDQIYGKVLYKKVSLFNWQKVN